MKYKLKFPSGILKKNIKGRDLSTFKTGGKIKYYFIPNSIEDLKNLLQEITKYNIKFFIIGNGSNILISDKGFNGIFINLKGFTNYIEIRKNKIICGASVSLNTVIEYSKQYSLSGLENLAGIPGTIGGALIMNAGAFNTEIGDFVEYVKIIDRKGKIKTLKQSQIKFSYRKSTPLNKYIILESGLILKKGKRNLIEKKINEILKKRELKQPLEFPSAGSIFKRPANNYAGALIEKCGLKGFSIGGAMVSEKHANFIINKKKATSTDIYKLIIYIQKKVYENFKVNLIPEIKFIGKF